MLQIWFLDYPQRQSLTVIDQFYWISVCVGGGGRGGAIIRGRRLFFRLVAINRGAAIILGNTGSARSRRPYVYEEKESIIRLN